MKTKSTTEPKLLIISCKSTGEPLHEFYLEITEELTRWPEDPLRKIKEKRSLSLVVYDLVDKEFVTRWGAYTTYNSAAPEASEVSVTEGSICINQPRLRSIGLGSFLLNYSITWAKQYSHFENARVRSIFLSKGDARSVENKLRRNKLYDKFNFQFDWHDDDHRVGYSKKNLTIKDLKTFALDYTKTLSLYDVLYTKNHQIKELKYSKKASYNAALYWGELFSKEKNRKKNWIKVSLFFFVLCCSSIYLSL